MISLPELLRRFRRVWVPPGAPLARVAPPADVAARLRAEVRPVLEAIGAMQQRASAVRAAADTNASALIDAANRDADERIRHAEAQAPDCRTAAAQEQWRAVEAEIGTAINDAQREVARIDAVSRERLSGLLEKVRTCVASGQELVS